MDITTILFLFYLNLTLAYKPIFNCDLQRLLQQNVYVNHLFTFFCFLYIIVLTDNTISFSQIWWKTLLIYGLFVMLTKSKIEYVGIVLLLLLVDQCVNSTIQTKLQKNTDEDVSKLKTARTYIKYVIFGVILIGFISYFFRQRADHKDFSFLTLLFGTPMCEGVF